MGKLTHYQVWDRLGGNIVDSYDAEDYAIIGIIDDHPVKLIPEQPKAVLATTRPVEFRPVPKPSSTKKTRGKKE